MNYTFFKRENFTRLRIHLKGSLYLSTADSVEDANWSALMTRLTSAVLS